MRENNPTVSVIIPIYNAEKYLAEAIESVLNQTYTNFELLLVNDKSTDNSKKICEKYAEKDNRVKLIDNNTENHGPGDARNIGLDNAVGEFTYFLDADDWIEKDLLYDTVALAKKSNADIVPFGYIIEEGDKSIRKKLSPCGNFDYEDFKSIANEIVRGTWGVGRQLTRSGILKNVRHNKYKNGEDICFQMDLLCNAKKVSGIDKEYYHYRMVKDSISHEVKWDGSFAPMCIAIWEKEKQFLEYCGINEESQTMKNTAIERYTGCIYLICNNKYRITLSEKNRQIKYIGDKIEIKKYKEEYDYSGYSGMRKIAKFLVKHNLEAVMIIMGTMCHKIFDKLHILG